jgi:apolipoprotein N-acyltransferase
MMKETPLRKAVEQLGPLPGFLFASPFMAGVVAVIMCPVFFGVFFLFPAMGYGGSDALVLFDAFHVGAVMGFGFAILFLFGAAISVLIQKDEDERQYRLHFLCGGIFAAIFLVIADATSLQGVRAWIEPFGSIVYEPDVSGK